MKPFKVMLKNQSYIEEFAAFGDVPTVSDEQLEWVQAFVCDVYGHKGKDVNLLRYKLYSSRQGKLETHSIPPCLDSLHLHSRRAAYQTFVWRNCLIAKPDIPSPTGNVWELGENESISIKRNTVNPAPDEVLELMFCTCSRNCVQGKCPCVNNGLLRTDVCAKQQCENFMCFETEINEVADFLSSAEVEN